MLIKFGIQPSKTPMLSANIKKTNNILHIPQSIMLHFSISDSWFRV